MKKVFSPFQVFLFSLFLGPIIGAVMISIDYKAFKKRYWILNAFAPLFIISSVLIVDIIYIESTNVTPFIYTAILSFTYFLYSKRLEEELMSRQYRSFWDCIKISILILSVVFVLGLVFTVA